MTEKYPIMEVQHVGLSFHIHSQVEVSRERISAGRNYGAGQNVGRFASWQKVTERAR